MGYKISYENVEGEKFEIAAGDTLLQTFPPESLKYFLSFIITNLITNQRFQYKIDVEILVLNFWKIPVSFGQSSPEEQKIKIFLTREGFQRIQEALDGGMQENQEFIFDRQNSPKRPEDTPKQCVYSVKTGEASILCRISKDYTTYPKCEECNFPEYFAQCNYLKNARARKIETDQEDPYEISANCNKTGKELKNSELKNCVNQPCFEPITIKSPKQIQQVEEDKIVREIRDKIDNINLLMKSKNGFELFKIQQQKIWNILIEPCTTGEKFTSHILALKNIIDWMNTDELKMKITGEKPKEGSINYLETFLQEHYTTFDSGFIVKPLRRINKISQCFPRHKDTTEVIKEIKSLGIEYPVKDWQKLWDKIIFDFYSPLRNLEQLLSR